jgi:hypothetical protein
MGVPANRKLVGITLTFYGIVKFPGDNPEPPNGVHYLLAEGPLLFHKANASFDFQCHFGFGTPDFGHTFVHVDSLYGLGANVFEGETVPGGSDDLYRVENDYLGPYDNYFGGYCIVTPIWETELPADLASVVSDALIVGGSTKFTESMGAVGSKRGLRVARVSDHTCVYMALEPVTTIE